MSANPTTALSPNWAPPTELVREVVADLNAAPVDLLSTGAGSGERLYLEKLSLHYVRTLGERREILDARCPRPPSDLRVLEVGSFLGVICFALRKVGFQVTALDIPEFQSN